MKKIYIKKLKLGLSFILVMLIIVLHMSFKKIEASVSELCGKTDNFSIDNVLIQIGMPENVITELTEGQKEYIFEHLKEGSEYTGFASCDYIIDSTTGDITPMYLPISESDLTLSVIALKVNVSQNEYYYEIMPSFVWKKAVKVKNDSLACAMHSGWETTGEQNLRLYLKNTEGQRVQSVDISGIDPSSSGYNFKIPSNIGFVSGFYEGYAYFNVDKKAADATAKISMQYVHDTSSNCNVSYEISIGAASIVVNYNGNNIKIMSGVFNLNV